MSDQFDQPGGPPPDASDPERQDAYPWDAEPPPDVAGADDPATSRERHDAFTDARKCAFLRALMKTGCIQDACRRVGVSPRTVYRHQQDSPAFFDNCTVALRMSATPIEITAWQRAVEGVEHEFACGGQVHVRRRYSDGLLRLLLQGSNPKKYGSNPGFSRKRILKHERKQMEREVRARIAADRPSFEEAMEELDRKLAVFSVEDDRRRLAEGWTKSADGDWIPPGYAWVGLPEGEGASGSGGLASGEATPRDSV